MINRPVLYFALPALAAGLVIPAAVPAQPAATAQTAALAPADQPYHDLYSAIIGGLDLDQMAAIGADSIFDGMVRNEPSLAKVARGQPELRGKFRAIAAPYLKIWIGRSNDYRRPKMVELLKKHMNPGEAREVAAFYGSPLGKKFMKAYSANITADNTVDAAIKNRSGDVDKSVQRKDENASVDNAVAALMPTMTETEQRQLLAFSGTKGFQKMLKITELMGTIPEPGFEEITTPAEREAFGGAIRALFTEALGKR